MIKAKTKLALQKIKRINRIPELGVGLVNAFLRRNALSLIKNFKTGIRDMTFHLEKLKDGTIARKRALGYSEPEVPLYGRGDEVKSKSYINMLRVRKIKAGYVVRPSIARHWKASLTLRHLYAIHEYGKFIRARNNRIFQIPARPALTFAYEKTLRDMSKRDDAQMVKRAITQFINTGQATTLRTMEKRIRADAEKYGVQKFAEGSE